MFVIDRIEEGMAVILNDSKIYEKVSREAIEGNAREGAVVEKIKGRWTVNDRLTDEKMKEARNKLNRIFAKK